MVQKLKARLTLLLLLSAEVRSRDSEPLKTL